MVLIRHCNKLIAWYGSSYVPRFVESLLFFVFSLEVLQKWSLSFLCFYFLNYEKITRYGNRGGRQVDLMQHETMNLSHENMNLSHENMNLSLVNMNLATTWKHEFIAWMHEFLHENMNSSHKNMNLSHENMNLSHENINLSLENMNLPHENMNLPHDNMNSSHECMNLSHENMNLSHEKHEFIAWKTWIYHVVTCICSIYGMMNVILSHGNKILHHGRAKTWASYFRLDNFCNLLHWR